jgi:hypothetical protein
MTPHKWKNEITAWANGANLEWKWGFMNTWLLFDESSSIHFFVEHEGKEFRIKKDQQ